MPNKLGKRYACDVCGAVYLVVKPGAGSIECHGQSGRGAGGEATPFVGLIP